MIKQSLYVDSAKISLLLPKLYRLCEKYALRNKFAYYAGCLCHPVVLNIMMTYIIG